MLDRLLALLPPGLRAAFRTVATQVAGAAQAGPARLPDREPTLAPMPVVAPPAATNDNPLRAVHEAVERDLRASGHLR